MLKASASQVPTRVRNSTSASHAMTNLIFLRTEHSFALPGVEVGLRHQPLRGISRRDNCCVKRMHMRRFPYSPYVFRITHYVVMSDQYKTIVRIAESKLVVKKSRFIGLATSIDTIEAASAFLDLTREKYPNATHYCYGYSIGLGHANREYATDAGEPTNSAGPPILSAVSGCGLSNIICVVVRYYGGINLGIGGLIRAYGQCARDCLAGAEIKTGIFYRQLQIRVPYEGLGAVLNLCHRLKGKVLNVESDQQATVHLQIREREIDRFRENLHGIGSKIEVI